MNTKLLDHAWRVAKFAILTLLAAVVAWKGAINTAPQTSLVTTVMCVGFAIILSLTGVAIALDEPTAHRRVQ